MGDSRISGDEASGSADNDPGLGALTLGRVFGFSEEDATAIAQRFLISRDKDGVDQLDERTIGVRAKERGRAMFARGVVLRSKEAREEIKATFAPPMVSMVGPEPKPLLSRLIGWVPDVVRTTTSDCIRAWC